MHGLLACQDGRKDGSRWLLGYGGHGKVRSMISCSAHPYPDKFHMPGQLHLGLPCMALPSCDNLILWFLRLLKHVVPRAGQVYCAVRLGVQDAAVKLLINVDTAQLAVFSRVRLLCELL